MPSLAHLFHYFVLFVLSTGFLSAAYMVYVVYRPEGGGVAPLWGAAREMPHETLVQRRLYAIEAWLCFGFLALYVGLTSR